MAELQTTAFAIFEAEKEKELWQRISESTEINWSKEFLIENQDRFDWKELSGNTSLPWSSELIELFEERWDWQNLSMIIAHRGFISYADYVDFVARYHVKLDWAAICGDDNITPDIVKHYSGLIDWSALSANILFPWSRELLVQYQDKIDWNIFSESFFLRYCDPFFNTGTLELFKDQLDWSALSENRKLKWQIRLICKFKEYWDWAKLIDNPEIEWSKKMLEFFNEYIPTDDIEHLRESHLWERLMRAEQKPYRKLTEIEEFLATL